MKLKEIIDPAGLLVPLKAQTIRDASRQLGKALTASGSVVDPSRLEPFFEDEWPEDIVPVGSEAMVPHFRTDAVRKVVAAIGIAKEPIYREKDPNRSARIVVLLLAPATENALLLRTLRTFHRTLAAEDTVQAVLAAGSPEAVLEIEALLGAEIAGSLQVRDVMTKRVVHIGPDMAMAEAARLMATRSLTALPVVDENGSVVGMISDREIVKVMFPYVIRQSRQSAEQPDPLSDLEEDVARLPVREAMERSVLCLSDDQDLEEVARLMVNKDLHHLPVVRDGVITGFLTRNDVVRRLIAN